MMTGVMMCATVCLCAKRTTRPGRACASRRMSMVTAMGLVNLSGEHYAGDILVQYILFSKNRIITKRRSAVFLGGGVFDDDVVFLKPPKQHTGCLSAACDL